MEILTEYYFEIKHVKKSDNAKANTLSKKEKLQNINKILGVLLKQDKDRKIRYNYL